MISALQGRVLLNPGENFLTVMTGGVGYQLYTPLSVQTKVVKEPKEFFFFVYTHVRQDNLDLYGFLSREELVLFKLLLTVSGVGPKMALAVVDRGIEPVKKAIVTGDVSFFTLIPRLGKKNAQKIIIELKTKLGSLEDLDLQGNVSGETEDIMQALITMGFTRGAIYLALKKVPENLRTVEEKIKFCLKELAV